MRLIFSGGGTGGHVNPAVAMATAMQDKHPDCEVLFIGRKGGGENRAVTAAGLSLTTLDVSGLRRSISPSNIKSIAKAIRAEISARKLLRDFKPDAVVGTGGYVCWPVLHAACALGIPTLIHESNVYPGLVTRLLASRCDCVLLNSKETADHLKGRVHTHTVGNPLRRDFGRISRAEARARLGIGRDDIFILSFGGSIGALKLNDVCIEVMRSFSLKDRRIRHLHACGDRYFDSYKGDPLTRGVQGCRILPYIDDMPSVLPAADIVICRCGALTLSEISLLGIPAILIPSPNVTDNHQYKNGKRLSGAGAALLIEEQELSADSLSAGLKSLVSSPSRCKEMSRCMKRFGTPDATEMCVMQIEKLIGARL